MEKAQVLLKDGDVVQHPSGTFEKQMDKKTVERNAKVLIHTHSHLFANAGRMRRQDAMQGKNTARGTKIGIKNFEISGQKTLVYFQAPAKIDKDQSRSILEMATKNILAEAQKTEAQADGKKGSGKTTKK